MNSDFLRWLLNVRSIPKGSEGLRLAWEHPWPGWVWALLLIGVGLFAAWSYSRLAGRRLGRGILAAARSSLLLLVLVLISGPMLELPRETVEQDWVLILADRSASMTIADAEQARNSNVPPAAPPNQRISRDAELRAALTSQAAALKDLAQQRHVVWMGFHSGAFNLSTNEAPGGPGSASPLAPGSAGGSDEQLPNLGVADGRRTNLEAALEQALQRAAARPVSGIVVFSDGRTDMPGRALLRRLKDDKIRVYVIPLGSAEPLGDLAIRRVDAPRRAFVRDKVPVVVEVEARGMGGVAGDAAQNQALRGQIKLVDKATGEVLDRQPLDIETSTRRNVETSKGADEDSSDTSTITLTAEPTLAGEATWQVVIEPAVGGGQSDLVPENNLKPFEIQLIDRPLRVLYVEGYPRWEYRYVKNRLVREKSIESSIMLISADRDFAQEGNQPISRLPHTPEEFAAFDVIILGDVPATFFSPPQLDMIRAHVADHGAGLLWIAGERYLPSSYVGTALADLLPMRGSLKLPPIGEPVTMVPTPLAQRLGVLRLETAGTQHSALGTQNPALSGWPRELADPATGWSQLYYAQRIEPGQLKPAAEVLAQTAASYNGTPLPLVIDMRYGAGQSIYVATDEIWRWRYGRGDLLPDQFWVQMIRMLGRESLTNAGDPATLEINPRRVAVNQPLRIELRLLDAQLLQAQRSTVRAIIETDEGNRIGEIELQRVEGAGGGGGGDRYAATFLPDSADHLRIRIDDSTLAALKVQAAAEVFSPDDELQRPQTDHELLKSLAAATGGRVLEPDQLSQLSTLPNRAVRTIHPLSEPIWGSPLALALALLALTFEWIGRKIMRLV